MTASPLEEGLTEVIEEVNIMLYILVGKVLVLMLVNICHSVCEFVLWQILYISYWHEYGKVWESKNGQIREYGAKEHNLFYVWWKPNLIIKLNVYY